jgi:hypothetical protein
VGDDERRAARHGAVERALQARLGVAVDVGRGLVEDEHGRVAVERAREGDELALAGGEVRAALEDGRVEAPLAPLEQIERVDALERARTLLDPARGSPAAMLVATVPGKRKTSCGTTANCLRSSSGRRVVTSLPKHAHRARLELVEAQQQRGDGALACARGADEGDLLARLRGEDTSCSTGVPGLYRT